MTPRWPWQLLTPEGRQLLAGGFFATRNTGSLPPPILSACHGGSLRRDTLRLIDGAGPSVEVSQSESTSDEARVDEMEERSTGIRSEPQASPSPPQTSRRDEGEQGTASLAAENSALSTKPGKCTFSGMVVPIDAQRFRASGTSVVECPDCHALRTLELRRGVLRFKSHDKRKTTIPNTEPRWAKMDSDWDVVGE